MVYNWLDDVRSGKKEQDERKEEDLERTVLSKSEVGDVNWLNDVQSKEEHQDLSKEEELLSELAKTVALESTRTLLESKQEEVMTRARGVNKKLKKVELLRRKFWGGRTIL